MKSIVVFTVVLIGMVVGGDSLQCYDCNGDECQELKEHHLKACPNTGLAMACFTLNSHKSKKFDCRSFESSTENVLSRYHIEHCRAKRV